MTADTWAFRVAARRLDLANKELHAARMLAVAIDKHDKAVTTDPAFSTVCAEYEDALARLIHAAKANGRFPAGNCYGLEMRS